jgi:hypothetical protein
MKMFFKSIFVLLFAVLATSADIDWSADSITITTKIQLKELAIKVNNGNSFRNKTINLLNDIDLEGSEGDQWEPIGKLDCNFEGIFDGNGNVISGIYINNGKDYQGLFGITGIGLIKNLGIVAYISGGSSVGGLVGMNWGGGKINGCYASGTVKGSSNVGGLVGSNLGRVTIVNSYATTTVTATSYFGGIAGGLTGENSGYITNSYASGSVTGDYAGGLSGNMFNGWTVISYCYALASNAGNAEALIAQKDMGVIKGNEDLKSESDMRRQDTYMYWDFDNVWGINSNINNGFPYLLVLGATKDNPVTVANNSAKSITQSYVFAGIRNGQINLNLKAGNYTVELCNTQGRIVRRVNINALDGVNATGLRTDNLAKGVFILNMKQTGGNLVLKHKVTVK